MDIHVTQDGLDPAWDEFLCAHRAGCHEQSSLYGQLKAMLGWQPIRVIAQEGQTIVGGAQILARRLPGWGRVGYISKGPVAADGRDDVMAALYTHLGKTASRRAILLLNVQPPIGEPLYLQPLSQFKFEPSEYFVVPPDTVLIDLAPSPENILAQMKKDGRYNINRAMREGVVVREGSEQDVAQFYELTKTLADRRDFPYYSLEYYQTAWRLFAPKGMLKLFLAFYENEPLGGIMIIAFGHSAVYKWGASSTLHRDVMPNYLLQWQAMLWAKDSGCACYDMGGILPAEAEVLARDGKLPGDRSGVARFKLKFGGQLVHFPAAYDNYYILRPRWLVRRVANYVWKNRSLRNLVRGIRLSKSDHSKVDQ